MPDVAPGLPSRSDYGRLEAVRPDQLYDFLIQKHLAQRAGPHYDVRFGDPRLGLLSWATRKDLPPPGLKTMLFQQPVHRYGYRKFEGTIPKGQYGAGTVSKHLEGKLLVTKVAPDRIDFTTAYGRHPQRFVLLKTKGDRKNWLLVNATTTKALPHQKLQYTSLPAEQVESALKGLREGSSVQAKIDGASSLIQLTRKGIELLSFRQAKETGHPIIHTERFFSGRPELKDLPPELEGTVLKGELFGQTPKGTAIPPQELGGLLNASLAKSLEDQKQRGIKLRNMVFDIQQLGQKPVGVETPYAQRRQMLQRIMPFLPQDRFELSPEVQTPEEALQLWQSIQAGKHPLTREGVVIHPPTGKPSKAKTVEEADVHLTGTYPGEGKYLGQGIGGFTYALEPGGPTVGRVGTGLSDELRHQVFEEPESAVGRVARIRSQQQLPSGAYRTPAFLSYHEDYPKVGSDDVEKKLQALVDDWKSIKAKGSHTEKIVSERPYGCYYDRQTGEITFATGDWWSQDQVDAWRKELLKLVPEDKLTMEAEVGGPDGAVRIRPGEKAQLIPSEKYVKAVAKLAQDMSANELAREANKAEKPKSKEQAEAGNYRKGHVRAFGFHIAIENPKDSYREGEDKSGKKWRQLMHHHYGYIKRTESDADGDHVDVFLGHDLDSDKAFVVDQIKQEDGQFDEHKCMLGFRTSDEARKGYSANYEDGWKCGKIKELTMDQFKAWLKDGDTSKALNGQALPKAAEHKCDCDPNTPNGECEKCRRHRLGVTLLPWSEKPMPIQNEPIEDSPPAMKSATMHRGQGGSGMYVSAVAQELRKSAYQRHLSDIPLPGSGPAQLAGALNLYQQARTLARPAGEQLEEVGLERPRFEDILTSIVKQTGPRDVRTSFSPLRQNVKLRALLGGLAGAGVGGLGSYFGGLPTSKAVGATALGGLTGAGYMGARAGRHNRDLLRTAKLLRRYGVLTPQHLLDAYPLMTTQRKLAFDKNAVGAGAGRWLGLAARKAMRRPWTTAGLTAGGAATLNQVLGTRLTHGAARELGQTLRTGVTEATRGLSEGLGGGAGGGIGAAIGAAAKPVVDAAKDMAGPAIDAGAQMMTDKAKETGGNFLRENWPWMLLPAGGVLLGGGLARASDIYEDQFLDDEKQSAWQYLKRSMNGGNGGGGDAGGSVGVTTTTGPAVPNPLPQLTGRRRRKYVQAIAALPTTEIPVLPRSATPLPTTSPRVPATAAGVAASQGAPTPMPQQPAGVVKNPYWPMALQMSQALGNPQAQASRGMAGGLNAPTMGRMA